MSRENIRDHQQRMTLNLGISTQVSSNMKHILEGCPQIVLKLLTGFIPKERPVLSKC